VSHGAAGDAAPRMPSCVAPPNPSLPPSLAPRPASTRYQKLIYACRKSIAPPPSSDAAVAEEDAAAGAVTAAVTAAAGVFGDANPGDPDPTDTSLALKLHSKPGAPKTILLDFTGSTWTNTAWSSGTITVPPFDTGAARRQGGIGAGRGGGRGALAAAPSRTLPNASSDRLLLTNPLPASPPFTMPRRQQPWHPFHRRAAPNHRHMWGEGEPGVGPCLSCRASRQPAPPRLPDAIAAAAGHHPHRSRAAPLLAPRGPPHSAPPPRALGGRGLLAV
jgi:hypothetical protein